jgi:hypothetical protein
MTEEEIAMALGRCIGVVERGFGASVLASDFSILL